MSNTSELDKNRQKTILWSGHDPRSRRSSSHNSRVSEGCLISSEDQLRSSSSWCSLWSWWSSLSPGHSSEGCPSIRYQRQIGSSLRWTISHSLQARWGSLPVGATINLSRCSWRLPCVATQALLQRSYSLCGSSNSGSSRGSNLPRIPSSYSWWNRVQDSPSNHQVPESSLVSALWVRSNLGTQRSSSIWVPRLLF